MSYPLEERTYNFGKNTLFVLKKLPINIVNKPLITQLTRSSTSVGANYCEANGASSKGDFKNKIHICKKEAQESRHWLRLLSDTNPEFATLIVPLEQESKELSMIFAKIILTMNSKSSQRDTNT